MSQITTRNKNKRFAFLLSIATMITLLALTACGSNNKEESASSAAAGGNGYTVRIGYQKYASVNILKERGTLEAKLAEAGYKVEWTEFPGGPQLLEAMNVGSIDFGNVGEAPPIFAQAAGTPLIYLGHSPASPQAEAILVPENSPIKTGADLKGKKVALNKGSNVHYLLVKYLEQQGLQYSDIEVVFLPPADARAAFEGGKVDAWVIWEPFYSAAQLDTNARVLADGEGLVNNYEYYLSSRDLATKHKPAVDILIEQLKASDAWALNNQPELAKILAEKLGLKVEAIEQALSHRGFGVEPITDDIIAAQQEVADVFYELELIPNAIKVSEAVIK